MKKEITIFKKKLALVLSIIVLIGLFPLNTMALEAAPGLSIIAAKDSTGVNATLRNDTLADVSANFVFAIYEPNGKLSYYKEYLVTVGAESSKLQRFDYDVAAHPDYIMELFAWDSSSFVPLCKETTSLRCIPIDGSDVVYNGIYVSGDTAVTEFKFVMIDEFTKRGTAYTAKKSGNKWVNTKADGIDVVLAYGPSAAIGLALPKMEVSELRMPNANNRVRVVITQ